MTAQNREGAALRVFVQGGGCAGHKYGMAFDDTVEENDQVLDFGGLKVVVDDTSGPYLDGAEVDFHDSLEGSGFSITNPNMESSCGCGSSFKKKDGEQAGESHTGGECGSGCH